MDERQLRILRELEALGSLRAVAEALHVTPSAVTQQLQALQRGVGVPLTERRGRTLGLTEAGSALAAAAVDVHVALARAREVARGATDRPRGEVSVSGFNSIALTLFPALVQRFGRGEPVAVRLFDEDVAQEAFPRLAGRYDLVLAHRLDHTPAWPGTVRVTALLHEPLDVALPPEHPLAAKRRLSPSDVADQPWISTHEGFPVVATVDAIAAAAGHPVDIVHRVNEFSVAAELVRAGCGVALVPRWTVPRPRGVVLRPLARIPARRHVDVLCRPEQLTRAAVRAVLAQLRVLADDLRERSEVGEADA
ncbi:LysR family transcriptional regulator [Nocardioides ferulae]|uniref:LysR family transcriptional regulator n=1 Tax=Nocardioides ferulae TaxID=2340821 RepID=UPI000EACB998|nr:LysR family transcriptional regulator [Nocardioides ferulae]